MLQNEAPVFLRIAAVRENFPTQQRKDESTAAVVCVLLL